MLTSQKDVVKTTTCILGQSRKTTNDLSPSIGLNNINWQEKKRSQVFKICLLPRESSEYVHRSLQFIYIFFIKQKHLDICNISEGTLNLLSSSIEICKLYYFLRITSYFIMHCQRMEMIPLVSNYDKL